MATHSSVLAWRIPWTEDSGGPQSTGWQRIRHNWSNSAAVESRLTKKTFIQLQAWFGKRKKGPETSQSCYFTRIEGQSQGAGSGNQRNSREERHPVTSFGLCQGVWPQQNKRKEGGRRVSTQSTVLGLCPTWTVCISYLLPKLSSSSDRSPLALKYTWKAFTLKFGLRVFFGRGACMAPRHSKHTGKWTFPYVGAQLLQSCPTLCDSKDYSPPGSSVHGILQTRILEWHAIFFSRGSSWPKNWTRVFYVSCIGRQVLYH